MFSRATPLAVVGLLLASAGGAFVVAAADLSEPPVAAPIIGRLRVDDARALNDLALRTAAEAASRAAPPPAPPGLTHWPVPGPITSLFGEQRWYERHPGLDLDGVTGEPVMAAAAGRVELSGQAPPGYRGYGIVVLLDHGFGVQTLYAHLSRADVVPGDVVTAGQPLGLVGSTGFSTGSHLHFEVRVGGRVDDPAAWLPPR